MANPTSSIVAQHPPSSTIKLNWKLDNIECIELQYSRSFGGKYADTKKNLVRK